MRAALRRPVEGPGSSEHAVVGDIDGDTDWTAALEGVDAVVHLAARVHVMRDTPDGAAEFRRTNTDGTLKLASHAARAGVRRMVFVSSIKVNGEGTHGSPYTASSTPAPVDPYGVSKLEAELGLREISGFESVIVRPPLVHGPGVKGNLQRFCRLARAGLPMPFGSIRNRRDLVGVENLVDLLAVSLSHPAAAGRTFLVSDDHALSTPELYGAIAAAMNRPARMLPVPVAALRALGALAGLRDEVERLTGSLQVDITETKRVLGWAPPRTVEEGLAAMVRAYVEQRSGA